MNSLQHIIDSQESQVPSFGISGSERIRTSYTCKMLGMPYAELSSSSKKIDVVFARYVAFHELAKRGYSTTKIGNIFKRNHSTVIHGLREYVKLVDTGNEQFLTLINKYNYNRRIAIETIIDVVLDDIFMSNDFNLI